MTRTSSLVVLSLAALAAACGQLETPDLRTGTVQGRLLNANAGAYVYPFGRPDLKAQVGADGQFSMEGVPVETTAVVVIDGPDPINGTQRARRVEGIDVEGAERTELADLDAVSMPLAGAVAAAVQPAGGANAVAPTFTVTGTDQVDVVAPSGAAVLEPLPEGSFQLTARMAGFLENAAPVIVVSAATVPYVAMVVPLEVDPAEPAPGCVSTGCRNGLVCEPMDGLCYQCVVNDDCASYGLGSTCSGHTCQPGPGTTGRGICEPCALDSECADGACVTDVTGTFCTRPSAGASPAGFVHKTIDLRDMWVPLHGCAAFAIDFGSACFEPSTCAQLFGVSTVWATCKIGSGASGPGYCTGTCLSDADCILPGWMCDPSGMGFHYCIPRP